VERHWTPLNTTVVGEDGTRLMIVHRVEDVTRLVQEGEILRGEAAQLTHQVLLRARDLALANAALHESVEYRRRIVAIVGHDLRNPLSAIANGVNVLRVHFERMGAAAPRTIDLVQSAASRMEALLRDLDDYTVSQLDGRLPIQREWVNLRDVCLDVVSAMSLARPGARVELEPGENVGAYVDPKRKRQVLTNLITNALDHGAGDRPVLVALRRVTGGCVLTVSNEGEPIPRDVIPTLFEPFRRGPATDGAVRGGHMGLGLYIVQQIVQAHDGRVDVESTPRGTHFMVFVPIL
jgi:signal transduction histidine kinase